MDIKIKHKQLESAFDSMMKEFKDLDRADKSYDYYVYEKNRYVDLDVYNYYENVEDDWEDDSWILQYHPTSNDYTEENESPALYYAEWYFKNVINVLGIENFKKLLKPWFEKNYGLPVNNVNEEIG
jgi:hypothetical protein